MTAELIPPAIKQEIDAAVAAAVVSVPRIVSVAMLEQAGGIRRDLSAKAKQLEARRMEITRPMDTAKASVMELFRGPLDALKAGERGWNAEIVRYENEQYEIRREAERKAQAAAEKEIREREARAAELRAKAETSEDEKERARLEAYAEAQEEKAANVVAMSPASPQKVDTVSMRTTWSAEVTDLRALCRAVADGVVGVEFVVPNMPALNKLAQALKEGTNTPGGLWQKAGIRAVSTKRSV